MNEERVMTPAECLQVNHETGLKYLKMSDDMKALAEKFSAHDASDPESAGWDFGKLAQIYEDLSSRVANIGDRLCQI